MAHERASTGYHSISPSEPSLHELQDNLSRISSPSNEDEPTEVGSQVHLDESSTANTEKNKLHVAEYKAPSSNLGRPWQTGFWPRFPTVGILALIGTLAAACGAVVTLVSSDRQVVGVWAGGIQPSTFLAIIALFSNMLLTMAFAQGLVLSFWRVCLQGTSVEGLHHSWSAGQSMLGAGTAVLKGHGYLSALALVLMTLSSARSPLNQAASIVSNTTVIREGIMDLRIAPRIPDFYLAVSTSSRSESTLPPARLSNDFNNIVRKYNNGTPIILEHGHCGDTCEITFETFGFCASCESESRSLNPYREAPNPNDVFELYSTKVDAWEQGNITQGLDNYHAGLRFEVNYISGRSSDGNRTYVNRTCLLQPSVMTARARITNDGITTLLGRWNEDKCTAPLNYRVPRVDWFEQYTTIGGFWYVLKDLYTSSAMFVNRASTTQIIFTDVLANQYVTNGSTYSDIVFADPMDEMLDALRELSFRVSLFAADEEAAGKEFEKPLDSLQAVRFTGSTVTPIFVTRRSYMAAGFAIAVMGVAGVALLYYRWWELGRQVSMSPLEIARAFDAPLLRDVDSNSAVKEMLQQAGSQRIRYGRVSGALDGEGGYAKLRFDSSAVVERPRQGEAYHD